MSLIRTALCVAVLALVLCRQVWAENVSRNLPPEYSRTLEPLLTPLAPLLAEKPAAAAADLGGEVLLYERVIQVQEDGRRLIADHFSSRAATEAGTEALERDTSGFHRRRQKMYLARAETITPDGKRLPVREDASFIQTPQRAADESLYDDEAEVVIVYPDIKAGSATEYILVSEDLQARLPGQFSMQFVMTTLWPASLIRVAVELPRSMADRLTITGLGTVPEPQKEELQGGARVRYTWTVRNSKPGIQDTQRPSPVQTGPCVFLTTLRSWEEFMQWYWPQVEPKLVPGDKLKALAEEWTRDCQTREVVISTLLRRVSDDVRYTGLEFADGDLVPRSVDQTWENQYGDCKDKACLLAALLGVKGIKAHPALINTDFPGRVERRSPDFRHFNHCVVAVEREGGGWMFCDPTVPGLLPGMIGASDSDRDVLLVKKDPAWARTPVHDWGVMQFDLDAEMDAAGGISGWCRITAEGANAAGHAWRESKSNRQELIRRMQNLLSGYGAGLRVVDVKQQAAWKPGEPWKLEAYVVIPGTGGTMLSFPAERSIVPQLESQTERRTPWPFWRDKLVSTAKIKLPPGRVPERLHQPLKSSSRYADAEASWNWKEGIVTAALTVTTREDAVAAADWPAFHEQMGAVHAWLDRQLSLGEGDKPAETPEPSGMSLAKMPTVEGQIDLVEEKYPVRGNAAARREALEKAQALFPGDKDMTLRAGWRLASLDISRKDPEAALRRIDGFLESCRSAATADEAAGADFVRAQALRDLKRSGEAAALFQKIAAGEEVSAFRRTAAFYQIARHQSATDKAAALAALEKGLELQSENEGLLYPLWFQLHLETGGKDRAAARLKQLVESRPDDAPGLLETMLEYSGNLTLEQNREMIALLSGFKDVSPAVASRLREADARVQLAGVTEKIKERAARELKERGPDFGTVELPETMKSSADFTQAAEALDGRSAMAHRAARYTLEALIRCGESDDISVLVWDYCRFVEWWARLVPGEKSAAVLDGAFAIGRMIPSASVQGQDILLLQSEVLLRRGQIPEAKAILESIVAAPLESYSAALTSARKKLARLAVDEQRWEDALKLADLLIEESDDAAVHAAWIGTYVCILTEKWDDAFVWIGHLRQIPEKTRRGLEWADQLERLLKFTEDRKTAESWWKGRAAWWKVWQEVYRKGAALKADPAVKYTELDAVENGGGVAGKMRDGNTAAAFGEMHLLASAAVLDPYFMVRFCAVISNAGMDPVLKPLLAKCYRVTLEADAFFPAGDAATYRKWLDSLSACHIIQGEIKKCWETARRFMAIAHESDDVTARITLRRLVVMFKDRRLFAEDAVTLAQESLEGKWCPEDFRANMLYVAAAVLQVQRENKRALSLIDRYLPSVPGEGSDTADLLVLRKDLEKRVAAAALDAPSVTPGAFVAWVDQLRLPWLEYVEPRTLEEAVRIDRENARRDVVDYTAAERFKTIWLIAKSGRSPESSAYPAGWAAQFAMDYLQGESRTHRALNAVMSSSGWSDELRADILIYAASKALAFDGKRRLKPWLQYPVFQNPPASRKEEISLLRTLGETTASTRETLLKAAEYAPSRPSPPGLAVASVVLRKLHAAGDFKVASALLKRISDTAVKNGSSDFAGWIDQLQKAAADSEVWMPVHEAIKAAVMKQWPECATMEEPLDALRKSTWLYESRLVQYADREAMSLLLWWGRHGYFDHSGPGFWALFFDTAKSLPLPTRRSLAEAMAGAVPKGGEEDAVAFCLSVFDADAPAEDQVMDQILAGLRKREGLSKSAQGALEWTTVFRRLRRGEPVDFKAVLQQLPPSGFRARFVSQAFTAAVARGDTGLAEEIMKANPVVAGIANPAVAQTVVKAWSLLGNARAEREGKDALRLHARAMFSSGWSTQNSRDVIDALKICRDLGEPGLIPPRLMEECLNWTGNERLLADLRMLQAAIAMDWAACAGVSSRAMAEYPTWHHYKFFHGLSCFHLGRKDEALASLEAYLKIVHNELDCIEARDLVAKLRK